MAIRTRAEAIATVFSIDVADVKDGRYHYGRTTAPVFTLGENYYCATKFGRGEKPAQMFDDKDRWSWVEKHDAFVQSQGWQVWESKPTNS
jgi:hypothetical protein